MAQSALLAAGATLSGRGQGAALPTQYGIQLYTLRDPLGLDFEGTLERVAGLGYREVEFAGYHDRSPAAVRELLDGLGLRAPSAHVPLEAVEAQFDETLEAAAIVGHRFLVVPWIAPWQRGSLDDYRALADLLNSAGERARAAGITLGYHNHEFEFEAIDGEVPYDLLLQRTDAALVTMELDLYWAHIAGRSSEQLFTDWPGRFRLCHVKDAAEDGSMVDVGYGVIDYRTLLASARAAGISHFFVEHDNPDDPLVTAARSISKLRNLPRA